MPLLTGKAKPSRRTPKKRAPRSLSHLATRIFNTPLMIHPQKLEVILAVLGPRLGLAAEAIPAVPIPNMEKRDAPDPDYDMDGGVAVIPVQGTLVSRTMDVSPMSGSLTSYAEIRSQIDQAMADDNCTAILFDIDSPGGESSGVFDLSDYIYSLRGAKPMTAVCEDAYSAAYAIASAADQIFVSRTGGVGSIGCYMLHCDRSAQDAMQGLKYEYIKSGDRKTDGNPHESLVPEARVASQAEVDRQRQMFVDLVARNRGVDAQTIWDTQAGCFNPEQALPMLADKIGTIDDALAALLASEDADEDENLNPSQIEEDGEGGGGSGDDNQIPAAADSRPSAMRPTEQPATWMIISAEVIRPHKTPTSSSSWDGPANEARLKLNQTASYYRKAYAWVDTTKDSAKNNAYKFVHHEVSGSGDIGAANIQACRSGIGVLNGARGGTTIPAADRKGVYAHLSKHIKDAGLEPPELKSEAYALSAALESVQELDPDPMISVVSILGLGRHAASFRIWRDGGHSAGYAAVHSYQHSDIELHVRSFATRAQVQPASGRLITCCVAPYGQLSSDLGGFVEVYQPGCFTESLESGDPRALFNHDTACVLGRRSAGTARFYEQPDGLYFEAEAPETSWANDLLVSMRRGDITQGSAACFILRPRWEYRGSQKVRVIEKAKLVEGSVASFAAYESTTAAPAEPAAIAAEHLQLAAQHQQLSARLRLLKAA